MPIDLNVKHPVVLDLCDYVKVTCRYFKASGKYYEESICLVHKEIIKQLVYPHSVGQWLKEQAKLPGLASGVWEDHFTCYVDDMYEELV